MRGALVVPLSGKCLNPAHACVELTVDVVDDVVDRRALLDDLADAGDDAVQAGRDLAQLHDGHDEEVDEREDDQHGGDDRDRAHGFDGCDDHGSP